MRAGDEQQYTAFVLASSARLRRVAYLVCGDWHRAEDAVQHAYVRLYQTWSRVQDPAAMERYVRVTAVRWLIDESRRPWRRERAHAAVPDRAAPDADPTAGLDVRDALSKVPPRQRAALVLRFYEGYDVAETAALLGVTPGTVKSQTARGLATLRALLGEAELVDTELDDSVLVGTDTEG